MIAVCGDHVETHGLVQPDVSGKGAVTGGHQNLLPIAGVAAASGLKMVTVLLKATCAFQQFLARLDQKWTAFKPISLGCCKVAQWRQAFETVGTVAKVRESKHAKCLFEGVLQASLTQVIRADKAIL